MEKKPKIIHVTDNKCSDWYGDSVPSNMENKYLFIDDAIDFDGKKTKNYQSLMFVANEATENPFCQ